MDKAPDKRKGLSDPLLVGGVGAFVVFLGIVMIYNATPRGLALGPAAIIGGIVLIAAALVWGAARRR